MSSSPSAKVTAARSASGNPDRFIIYAGDASGLRPNERRSLNAGRPTLVRQANRLEFAASLAIQKPFGDVSIDAELFDEVPKVDFDPTDDVVAFSIKLDRATDLRVLSSVWQQPGAVPAEQFQPEPPVLLENLAAGKYRVRVRARGRDRNRETFHVDVWPENELHIAQVIQTGSEFIQEFKPTKQASLRVPVAEREWVVFMSGEATRAGDLQMPEWLLDHSPRQAMYLGDALAGQDASDARFVALKVASLGGTVGAVVNVSDHGPSNIRENVGPRDDAKLTEFVSEGGKLTLYASNGQPARVIELPKAGRYGLHLISTARDSAMNKNRVQPNSPETLIFNVWPLADGESVEPQTLLQSNAAKRDLPDVYRMLALDQQGPRNSGPQIDPEL